MFQFTKKLLLLAAFASAAMGAVWAAGSEPTPQKESRLASEVTNPEAKAATQSAVAGPPLVGVSSNPLEAKLPSDADSHEGAFEWSFPINIPAGTNDVQPALSLAYNSGSPDGILGMGFSIQGLSVIERDSSRGINFSSSDSYVLDGQKLYYKATGSGGDGNFHLEHENFERIQAFLKTAPNTPIANPNNANAFWVVKKKDGRQFFYGDDSGSGSASTIPAVDKTTPRLWALSKVQDANGNFYRIFYTYDPSTGAYYPLKIVYTLGNGRSTTKTVQFSYDTVRTDHWKRYAPAAVELLWRLRCVSVLAGTDGTGSGGSLVRKYWIQYQYGTATGRSQVTSIQEFGQDGNSPSAGDMGSFSPSGSSLPATQFSWQDAALPALTDGKWTSAGPGDANINLTGDYNGDGNTDLMQHVDGGWRVLLSNGVDHFRDANSSDLLSWSSAGTGDSLINLTGDFNGDGKTDFMQHVGAGWRVLLSNGVNHFDDGIWTTAGLGDNRINIVGDFNGDGRTDFMQHVSGGWRVLLSNGVNHFDDSIWTTAGTGDQLITLPGDFNGDGKTDFMQHISTGWRVLISNGVNHFDDSVWSSGNIGDSYIGDSYVNLLGDFNGDGKTDFLQRHDTGWRVLISNGINRFLDSEWSTRGIDAYNMTGDFNGDGRTDFIQSVEEGWRVLWSNGRNHFDDKLGTAAGQKTFNMTGDFNGDGKTDFMQRLQDGWRVLLSDGPSPDLLKTITLSSGGSVTATYLPAPQIATWAGSMGPIQPSLSSYPSVTNASTRPLVTQIVTNPKLGSLPSITTSFQYFNGKFLSGLGANRVDLGFQKILRTTNGAQKQTTFSQDPTLHGVVLSEVIKDLAAAGTKNLYSAIDSTYVAVPNVLSAPNFIKLTQTVQSQYDGQDNSSPIRKKQTMTYDNSNGNLVQTIDWGLVNGSLQPIDKGGALSDQAKVQVDYDYVSNTTFPNYVFRIKQKTVSGWNLGHFVFGAASRAKYYYDNQLFGFLGTSGDIGLLTQVDDSIDDATVATRTMTYDASGNLSTVKDARVNSNEYGGTTETRTYDPTYSSGLATVTNAKGQLATTNYDTLMRPTSIIDTNNQVWATHYDVFSRADYAVSPDDDTTNPTTTTLYVDTALPRYTRSRQKTSQAGEAASYLDTYTYFDGLGRTVQTKRQGTSGWITQDYSYDATGRNNTTSVPYLSGTNAYSAADSSHGVTSFAYDVLNRVTMMTRPDTSTVQTQYLETTTRTIDENRHVTAVEDYGNVQIVTKFNGVYPNQTYDATVGSKMTTNTYRGLIAITDNKGNVVSSNTDMLGRRIRYQDPDLGIWLYEFDGNGNLKKRTDGKSPAQILNYGYDSLNRIVSKDSPSDATVAANYVYDEPGHGVGAVGNLTSLTYNRGSDSIDYDSRGRVASKTRTLDGMPQTESFSYDSMNRQRTQTLPDLEVVTSTYGTDGNLLSLQGLLGGQTTPYLAATYFPTGRVQTFNFGNGVATNYYYYDDTTLDLQTGKALSYRLRQIQVVGPSGSILNLGYSYYPNGNVSSRTDGNTIGHSETYGYDAMDRLTQAASGVSGTLAFEYDSIDNITRKDGFTYSYDASHPHAVQNSGSFNYLYDANGNMVTRSGGRTLTYDAENRVTSVSDGGTYSYDAGRQRTIKTEGTKTNYYFFPDYEQEYTSGVLTDTTKYYSADDQKIAQGSTSQALTFFHSDHLGSSAKMTDATGTEVRSQGHKPYGGDSYLSGSVSTKVQFTGQEKDTEGLYYYNARYYDPDLGRFIQPDPAVWDPKQTASLSLAEQANPYLYALNNPVVYTDPTGLFQVYRAFDSDSGRSYYSMTTYWSQGTVAALTTYGLESAVNIVPFAGSVFGSLRQGVANLTDVVLGTNSKMVFDSTIKTPDGSAGGGAAFDLLSLVRSGAPAIADALGKSFSGASVATDAIPTAIKDAQVQAFLDRSNYYSILGSAENDTQAIGLANTFAAGAEAYYNKGLDQAGISADDWASALQDVMQGNQNDLYDDYMGD